VYLFDPSVDGRVDASFASHSASTISSQKHDAVVINLPAAFPARLHEGTSPRAAASTRRNGNVFLGVWRLIRALALLALSVLACPAHGKESDAQWSFDLLIGDAYNADSRTRIEHATLDNVSFTGDYDTRGLEGPLHYAWRIARWEDARGWELQLLHHKLFLQNPPAGVDALSISHGFNIVTINRAFEYRGWQMRAGLGPVITHAEARILGTAYDGPYEIAGAAVLVGVGRRLELGRHFYLLGEVAATYGYIHAEPDGAPNLEVTIRNPALHAQAGVGYRF
jgi:hypothetical protein